MPLAMLCLSCSMRLHQLMHECFFCKSPMCHGGSASCVMALCQQKSHALVLIVSTSLCRTDSTVSDTTVLLWISIFTPNVHDLNVFPTVQARTHGMHRGGLGDLFQGEHERVLWLKLVTPAYLESLDRDSTIPKPGANFQTLESKVVHMLQAPINSNKICFHKPHLLCS